MLRENATVPMVWSVRVMPARLILSVMAAGCACMAAVPVRAQDLASQMQRAQAAVDDQSPAQDADAVAVPAQDVDAMDADAVLRRDGVIETDEPAPMFDGADAATTDARSLEEAQLFENPPSAVDALLFQVEDLSPILDRRPQRLFRFEPYDPVGVRVASFVLFPELELAGDGFTNLFRATTARSDAAFDVRPSARLVSNWRRHALEFRARGTATFFNAFPTENEKSYTLETRARLDVAKRTNIQTALSQDVTQESRSDQAARGVGQRANVTAITASMALNHRLNRLSLQLRGAVTDTEYGNSATAGLAVDNAARNYTANLQAARATWEFKPTLSVFSEVEVNQRDYRLRDASGVDQSSAGERYRVGLSFGNTGEYVRGEVSSGWGIQRPSQATLPDVSGVIIDANVTFKASALTSLAATARSEFAETTASGVGGVRSHEVGIELRHAIQRHLIATAGLGYTVADYVGSTLTEQELRATLGVEYFLNRETVLFSRYLHSEFSSNSANADYAADELRIGVRLRR